MPVLSLWNFPLALSLLILYKLFTSIRERRRQNAESVRRGCGPCRILPKKDVLGITRFRESIRATRAERGPKYILEEMDAEGKHVHTAQVRVLDYDLNVTRDPENVKACFSSQSQDFDIGLHRTQSWKPLLGTGIFTSQGEACTYGPKRSFTCVSCLEERRSPTSSLSYRLIVRIEYTRADSDSVPREALSSFGAAAILQRASIRFRSRREAYARTFGQDRVRG